MATIIEVLRERLPIEQVVEHYGLQMNQQRKILCNVTNEKTPSCAFTSNNKFYCYSCGAKGDVVDFIMHQEQCDITAAIKIGCQIAGIGDAQLSEAELAQIEERKAKRAEEKKKADEYLAKVIALNQPIAAKYCTQCAANIEQTDYFAKRGITLETQRRFGLGYEPKKKVVIIPYGKDKTYFCTRSTEEKRFWKPLSYLRVLPNGEYDYQKTDWILGDEPIFNAEVLFSEGIVVVCESQIDAISLCQAGMKACAIGGTCGLAKLEEVRDKIKSYLLFGFDNDEAGQKAAQKATAIFWSNIIKPLPPYKDWNEWLATNPAEFMAQVGNMAQIFNK